MKINKDLTGKRFDYLEVLEGERRITNGGYYKTYWKCRCNKCGNVCEKSGDSIIRKIKHPKMCKSCWYKHQEFLYTYPDNKSILKDILRSYKSGRRCLDFYIEDEEFFKMIKKPCHYCGDEPSLKKRKKSNKKKSIVEIAYNGLDRVDNKKPYTVENVVTCCHICNSMKSNLDSETFYNQINKINKRSTTRLNAVGSSESK